MTTTFRDLDLNPKIISALAGLGYQQPTAIQAKSIPVLLQAQDMIAQAQTGTGKTAAFALPILNKLRVKQRSPQALIITPTRELAIQVADAFKSYAKHLSGISITTLYGGANYRSQLQDLKRGAQIVVGTPGRVMDHIRRQSLQLDNISSLILDEADEMLKMGFIEDVEWILEKIPHTHQIALFSATMPKEIKKIAQRYLQAPMHIHIKTKTEQVEKIHQFYTRVPYQHKVDVLSRFLMIEKVDAAFVFVRTKHESNDVADYLKSKGHAASALNGDMNQSMRQQVVEKIKRGKLDIIVATDVAARGIDVERVSHVFNYDMPHDKDAYIHRIGRTGRAGRSGKALTFVTPREIRSLTRLEKDINEKIKMLDAPSNKEIINLQQKIMSEKVYGVVTKSKKLESYQKMVDALTQSAGLNTRDIAAAFAYLLDQATGIQLPSTDQDKEIKDKKHKRSHTKTKSDKQFVKPKKKFTKKRKKERLI